MDHAVTAAVWFILFGTIWLAAQAADRVPSCTIAISALVFMISAVTLVQG